MYFFIFFCFHFIYFPLLFRISLSVFLIFFAFAGVAYFRAKFPAAAHRTLWQASVWGEKMKQNKKQTNKQQKWRNHTNKSRICYKTVLITLINLLFSINHFILLFRCCRCNFPRIRGSHGRASPPMTCRVHMITYTALLRPISISARSCMCLIPPSLVHTIIWLTHTSMPHGSHKQHTHPFCTWFCNHPFCVFLMRKVPSPPLLYPD